MENHIAIWMSGSGPSSGAKRQARPAFAKRPAQLGEKKGFAFGINQHGENTGGAHYQKHGAEFEATSTAEYLRMAREFFQDESKGNEYFEIGNTVIKFHPETGTFGVVNSGEIKTFYKYDPMISSDPVAFAAVFTLDLNKDGQSRETAIQKIVEAGLDYKQAVIEVAAHKKNSTEENKASKAAAGQAQGDKEAYLKQVKILFPNAKESKLKKTNKGAWIHPKGAKYAVDVYPDLNDDKPAGAHLVLVNENDDETFTILAFP